VTDTAGARKTAKKRKADSSRDFVAGFFDLVAPDRLGLPDCLEIFGAVRAMTHPTVLSHCALDLFQLQFFAPKAV
jgi:hypothetical protein